MVTEDYQIIDSKQAFNGEIFKIFVDHVRLPGGQVVEREVLAHAGAVGIVPVTADNNIILVEQYRHAARRRLWEIPAGKLDGGEKPLDCAARELREETGAIAGKITKLAEFYNSPGYSNERFHLYLAEVEAIGEPQPDGDEESDLGLMTLPLPDALKKVDSGEICDAKSIIGLFMADRVIKSR